MTASTAPIAVIAPAHGGVRAGGLLLGVTSALAFSSSGPFVKPLLEAGWSLGAALLIRMSVAGLILSPALVRALRARPGVLRRQWRLIAGFGLCGVAGCQLFFFSALQRMPVAVALLIQYLAPVLLVLLAWVRTRRAPSRVVLLGSLVSVVGLVLVVDISGARFDLLGTLFALAAAVCVGAYFLIAERAGDDMPPLALASAGLLAGAGLIGVLCLTGLMPFAAPSVTVLLGGLPVPGIMAIAWISAVATTLGYAFGVMAIPRLGSRVASFVGLSEVLFALGFAWLLLGEAPAPVQLAGGALIVVGVVLVRADATSAAAAMTSVEPGA